MGGGVCVCMRVFMYGHTIAEAWGLNAQPVYQRSILFHISHDYTWQYTSYIFSAELSGV